MHNVVFYGSIAQLQEKLARLRAEPALAQQIASNGQALAATKYTFGEIGRRIVEELQPPLRAHPPLNLWMRLRLKLGI
ncbi:hypothetical protein D3C81_1822700 [compost metagenome]